MFISLSGRAALRFLSSSSQKPSWVSHSRVDGNYPLHKLNMSHLLPPCRPWSRHGWGAALQVGISIFQSEFCGGSCLVYLHVCPQCLEYSAHKIVFWAVTALQVTIRQLGNACAPPGLTRLHPDLASQRAPSVSCCFQVGNQSRSSRVSEGVSSQTSSCPTPLCQCHP